tara:strand:+ start:981 stop:1427 length:447 start_codon:yes stop_codon:yes gene_type:complete
MFSLLGSLLGFGTSFLPKVMDYFQDKQDKKHELQLMDKQLEQQIQIGNQKLDMVHVEADIRETEALLKSQTALTKSSSQWITDLAASVRPFITYLLFVEFMGLTMLLAGGYIDNAMYSLIWSDEVVGIWAAVISFWFGSRTFNRKSQT